MLVKITINVSVFDIENKNIVIKVAMHDITNVHFLPSFDSTRKNPARHPGTPETVSITIFLYKWSSSLMPFSNIRTGKKRVTPI